jgi:hypothetical protein
MVCVAIWKYLTDIMVLAAGSLPTSENDNGKDVGAPATGLKSMTQERPPHGVMDSDGR